MRILGLDPGYGRTGYGVVEATGGVLHAIAYGCIETKKETPFGERLFALKCALDTLVKTHKPKYLAVEKIFFTKNAKTALQVGEARGVVILTAAMHRIPTIELGPLEVKMALTGYGRAEKKQIQRMVQAMLHLSRAPTPDDVSDALAIAIAAIGHTRFAK